MLLYGRVVARVDGVLYLVCVAQELSVAKTSLVSNRRVCRSWNCHLDRLT